MDSSKSWKQFEDYSGYRISDHGDIYSCKLKRCIQPPICKEYYRIGLWKQQTVKKIYVHRLVAKLFIPNPDNLPVVNHKDGNKLNNCVDNLEWETVGGNNLHAREVLGVITGNFTSTPVTLVKGNEEVTFEKTRDAIAFLKCSGRIWREFKEGVRQVKGYSIKK